MTREIRDHVWALGQSCLVNYKRVVEILVQGINLFLVGELFYLHNFANICF